MENDKMIPLIAHESMLARMERTIKRLWILCIVLIVLLVGSNVAWLYYESQFEEVVTTVEQEVDTGEGDAYVTGVGNIYGEDQTESNAEDPQ